jgi:hypothetical protein
MKEEGDVGGKRRQEGAALDGDSAALHLHQLACSFSGSEMNYTPNDEVNLAVVP